MRRFKFPLKSVIVVREAREARARDAFLAAVHAAIAAERELECLVAERASIERVLIAERQSSFRAAEQAGFLQSLHRVESREALARDAVRKAQEFREWQRQAWLEARRDVRLIEKLRTTALEKFRRDFEREAQRILDDHTGAAVARESSAFATNSVLPT
ncbi:MAG: flagellar FliJ family protein [Opitutaceae bacterium]|nr:flagellar FliJ family protein [Opitutaceae bacterium]